MYSRVGSDIDVLVLGICSSTEFWQQLVLLNGMVASSVHDVCAGSTVGSVRASCWLNPTP